jgi:hypothetical protein
MRFQLVREEKCSAAQIQRKKNQLRQNNTQGVFSSQLLGGVSVLKAAGFFKAQVTHSSLHCGIGSPHCQA